jgi:hypothetical protein
LLEIMASNTPTIHSASIATLCLTALLVLGPGCSASRPVAHRPPPLPENVLADPPRLVDILTPPGPSPLATALRALGIPFRRSIVHEDSALAMPQSPFAILDEEIMASEAGARMLPGLLRWTRAGGTMVMLVQSPGVMAELRRRVPQDIIQREVSYTLQLHPAHEHEKILAEPNRITRSDLDSLAPGARQLALGNVDARAVIAGNTIHPDSSAALLVEPYGKGALWYLGFPVTARAAAGDPAGQKLLANIASALARRRL